MYKLKVLLESGYLLNAGSGRLIGI